MGKRGITYLAIEGMSLVGVEAGQPVICCVPLNYDRGVSAHPFGFFAPTPLLREMAVGLERVCALVDRAVPQLEADLAVGHGVIDTGVCTCCGLWQRDCVDAGPPCEPRRPIMFVEGHAR